MAVHMVEAVKANGFKLDQDGRTLFQIAFKNEIGARRTSLRNIPPLGSAEGKDDHIRDIKAKIVGELEKLCGDVLQVTYVTLYINAGLPKDWLKHHRTLLSRQVCSSIIPGLSRKCIQHDRKSHRMMNMASKNKPTCDTIFIHEFPMTV